jgi:type IV pilus assembly protein PilA
VSEHGAGRVVEGDHRRLRLTPPVECPYVPPSTMYRQKRTKPQSTSLTRAFTLVELMFTVAILGILSTIAIGKFKQHIGMSKSVEAMTNVGAIARAIKMAAERDRTDSAVLATGTSSFTNQSADKVTGGGSKGKKAATVTHGGSGGLCGDATSVPDSFNSVKGKKYQPSNAPGVDDNTGDALTGWKCLRFTMDSPQYYQYTYATGGPPVSVKLPHGGAPPGLSADYEWNVTAQGDVDGDGISSWFVLDGYITDDGIIMAAPWIGLQDSEE